MQTNNHTYATKKRTAGLIPTVRFLLYFINRTHGLLNVYRVDINQLARLNARVAF